MGFSYWLTNGLRILAGRKAPGMERRRWPRLLEIELLEKRELLSATDDLFVSQVYRDLLHREAGSGELAAWSRLLNEGTSRADVALGVAGSPEYAAGLVRGLYGAYLHRDASTGEQD